MFPVVFFLNPVFEFIPPLSLWLMFPVDPAVPALEFDSCDLVGTRPGALLVSSELWASSRVRICFSLLLTRDPSLLILSMKS